MTARSTGPGEPVTLPDGIAHTFTAHNVVLPDGSQTLYGAQPVADSGTCQAALRDLALAFPGPHFRPVMIADLGCLEGGYAAAFAQAGYDVTGFEVRTENFLCCRYVQERLALPNLQFIQADVRDAFAGDGEQWDAVFCCGLLYHLENPVAFLRRLGEVTRKLLILQTHYSTRPDAVHEGSDGHWYQENTTRWSSWQNPKSFWLTRDHLLAVICEAGFDLVFEQADYRADIRAGAGADPDARGMFVGIKT
jgi:SAM-dependent methyltransferase